MTASVITDGLLNTTEAAAALDVHRCTVLEMIHDGRIRGARNIGVPGRPRWRIPAASVLGAGTEYVPPKRRPSR